MIILTNLSTFQSEASSHVDANAYLHQGQLEDLMADYGELATKVLIAGKAWIARNGVDMAAAEASLDLLLASRR